MEPEGHVTVSLLALLGLVNYFPIQREDVGAEGRERRRVERKHAAADQPVAVDVGERRAARHRPAPQCRPGLGDAGRLRQPRGRGRRGRPRPCLVFRAGYRSASFGFQFLGDNPTTPSSRLCRVIIVVVDFYEKNRGSDRAG